MHSPMATVFATFAAFWVVAFATLYFGVGALLRQRDRLLARSRSAPHDPRH